MSNILQNGQPMSGYGWLWLAIPNRSGHAVREMRKAQSRLSPRRVPWPWVQHLYPFEGAVLPHSASQWPPRLRYIGLHTDVSPEVAARYDHTPRIPRSTIVEGSPPADLLASYAPPPARSPSPVAGPSRSVRRRVQDLAGGLDAVERFVLRPGLLGAPNDAAGRVTPDEDTEMADAAAVDADLESEDAQ
ncbi:uncharacterized protein B0H18DRAFT_964819 [Fomitopsis serialis]|uniref:uncharacterized protein n=1 Tax=Fomitopsis serialis TaxID=139415 RepID=UPI0020088130|nr:uncharacterized protein B0H18DRAFT_964819 [Neoantrodia serialis]KAH9906087.1 hypothetical protein B0H18DRAFT_964819 [Neoantrodia serialis]